MKIAAPFFKAKFDSNSLPVMVTSVVYIWKTPPVAVAAFWRNLESVIYNCLKTPNRKPPVLALLLVMLDIDIMI